MVFFLLKLVLGNEEREVAVIDSVGLEAAVEEGLDLLPNVEAARPEDVAARDIVVVDQF